MAQIKTFRDLIAWQKAMALAKLVYQWPRALPKMEMFGLTFQMRRAAVSVPSNIAEGYARQSRADYVRFLRTARGSLAELITQVEVAVSVELIEHSAAVNDLLAETDRVLQGLIRSLSAPNEA